jgi:phospholipid/cholesterol/gamma-HCH transport system substrate-binding protein
MRNTLETRLGLFVTFAVIVGALILEMIGGTALFRRGMDLKARFNNVQELKEGDPVKMAGVQIGRVKEIGFAANKVLVIMRITERKAAVRTDSKATVRFTGLMGQNYLNIDFGSGKGANALPDAELETIEQPDLSALMSKLEGVSTGVKKMTDTISDVNFNELLLPFTDFLKENRSRIAGILTNAQAVSEQIAAGKGTVGKLIFDEALHQTALNTLTNVNQTADEIQATVKETRAVVAHVNAGKGTIGKLTKDETIYLETAAAITNLKEILRKINQGQGSVGRLVNDESLFKNAKMSLQKLDKATEGLEDQGPLSIIGMAVSKLF